MILVGRADEEELLNLMPERKGSLVTYFGYVRREANGKIVNEMQCNKKEDTERIMEDIEREIREKYDIEQVILYHTIGTVKVGELLAAVIVSSVHRDAGFEACRAGIDLIKEKEPVERIEQ